MEWAGGGGGLRSGLGRHLRLIDGISSTVTPCSLRKTLREYSKSLMIDIASRKCATMTSALLGGCERRVLNETAVAQPSTVSLRVSTSGCWGGCTHECACYVRRSGNSDAQRRRTFRATELRGNSSCRSRIAHTPIADSASHRVEEQSRLCTMVVTTVNRGRLHV